MNILHLSDTHVGYGDNAQRTRALLCDIATRYSPTSSVIVHTGDLIHHGHNEEMQCGRALLDPLAAQDWRILLAPGNHDYGDSLHVDPDWAATFRQQFAPYVFGSATAQFPILTLLDDCAFIGLDSNEAEMGFWERWMAEGYLGDAQIGKLNQLLDRQEVCERTVILYLHHHPFFDAPVVRADVGDRGYLAHLFGWNTRRFRRLKDAYSLMQCLRDRVDILLFGHQHFGLDYSAEGRRYGINWALDGSSSTATQMDTDRMRYRVIDTATGSVATHFVSFT